MSNNICTISSVESFACVRPRLEHMAITLHGWYFDMDAGALLAYSPRADAFLPLVCPFIPDPDVSMLAGAPRQCFNTA